MVSGNNLLLQNILRLLFKQYFLIKLIIALLVALSITLDDTIVYSGNRLDCYPTNFARQISISEVLIFAIIFVISFAALCLIQWVFLKVRERDCVLSTISEERQIGFVSFIKKHFGLTIILFVEVLAGWFIVLLNYYPGTSMNDQLWVIDAPITAAASHPLVHNLILTGCVRVLGLGILGSGTAGFAVYIFFQMMFCAAVVAVCAIWLRFRGAPRWLVIGFAFLFALTPVVSNFAICAIKDTLFSYILLAWIPFVYEALYNPDNFWKKRSSFILLVLLMVFTSLIRNNGLYIALLMCVVFVVLYRKIACKKLVCACFIGLILSFTPSFALSIMGVEQLFRESVGIPIQQVCAVVCEDSDSLSVNQLNYIDDIMPIACIKENYAPMSVDKIKFNQNFNTGYLQKTKSDFIRVYFEMGLSHPDEYWRSYLSQTWGFWSLRASSCTPETQSSFFSISSNMMDESLSYIMEEYDLGNYSLYPAGFSKIFDSLYRPSVEIHPGPGMLFLMVLLGGFALICLTGSRKYVLIILPMVILWLTLMIAVPISSSLRYVFPMLISIPLVYAIVITKALSSRNFDQHIRKDNPTCMP